MTFFSWEKLQDSFSEVISGKIKPITLLDIYLNI